MIHLYTSIVILITIAVTAQTLFKIGSARIKHVSLSSKTFIPFTHAMIINPPIIIGIILYIAGAILWLVLLSRLDLVFLYPFGSLEYIFVFLVARFVFHEHITRGKFIGLFFIISGLIILGKFG